MALLKRHSQYLLDVRRVAGSGEQCFLALGNTGRVGAIGLAGTVSTVESGYEVVYDVAFDGTKVYAVAGNRGNTSKALLVYDTSLALQSSTELWYDGDYGWVVAAGGYVLVPSQDSIVFFTSDRLEQVVSIQAPNVFSAAVYHDGVFTVFPATGYTARNITIAASELETGWIKSPHTGYYYKIEDATLTYAQAGAYENKGATLAVIPSEDEDNFILSDVMEYSVESTLPVSTYPELPNLARVDSVGWGSNKTDPYPIMFRDGVVGPQTYLYRIQENGRGPFKIWYEFANTGFEFISLSELVYVSWSVTSPPTISSPGSSGFAYIEFYDTEHNLISFEHGTPFTSYLAYTGDALAVYTASVNTNVRYAYGTASVQAFSVPTGTAFIRVGHESTASNTHCSDLVLSAIGGEASAVWVGLVNDQWERGDTDTYRNWASGEPAEAYGAKYIADGEWRGEEASVVHKPLLQITAPLREANYLEKAGVLYKPTVETFTSEQAATNVLWDNGFYYISGDLVVTPSSTTKYDSPRCLFFNNSELVVGDASNRLVAGIETTHFSLRIMSRGRYEIEVFE